jgi:hypothetical protein
MNFGCIGTSSADMTALTQKLGLARALIFFSIVNGGFLARLEPIIFHDSKIYLDAQAQLTQEPGSTPLRQIPAPDLWESLTFGLVVGVGSTAVAIVVCYSREFMCKPRHRTLKEQRSFFGNDISGYNIYL